MTCPFTIPPIPEETTSGALCRIADCIADPGVALSVRLYAGRVRKMERTLDEIVADAEEASAMAGRVVRLQPILSILDGGLTQTQTKGR